MKVLLALIGIGGIVGAIVFGIDAQWMITASTSVMQQQVGYMVMLCSIMCILITCVCFSACIKTTRKDLEEMGTSLNRTIRENK